MKPLAICIPTYKQPERIWEMCIRCLAIYQEAGIDVYVFDSSPDEETKMVLPDDQAGVGNLYYRYFPPDIHSNIKVLKAYQELLAMKTYQYLWLCPDYIQLTRQGTEKILCHCREGFDICVLNYRDVEQIGERVYSDINLFFRDCAWHMSSYMAAVIRLSSFADIDWVDFYKRYTTPKRISHSHVAFYLEQLAKLPKVKAVHVPVSSDHIRVSPYRDDSLWKKEVFSIWCEGWPDMIKALPDCYRDKEVVIKKLGVNTGIFSWDNLMVLRREGIYDRHIYHQYRQEWKRLTNVPKGLLWILALMSPKVAALFRKSGVKQRVLNWRLNRFCARHPDILIYGCGFMAKKTSLLLDEQKLRYQGYVVSDCTCEKQRFHGLPVIECGNLPANPSGTGLIIALNQTNTEQVLAQQQKLKAYDRFLMYPYERILETIGSQ